MSYNLASGCGQRPLFRVLLREEGAECSEADACALLTPRPSAPCIFTHAHHRNLELRCCSAALLHTSSPLRCQLRCLRHHFAEGTPAEGPRARSPHAVSYEQVKRLNTKEKRLDFILLPRLCFYLLGIVNELCAGDSFFLALNKFQLPDTTVYSLLKDILISSKFWSVGINILCKCPCAGFCEDIRSTVAGSMLKAC